MNQGLFALSAQRRIRVFDGRVGSTTFLAVSPPAAGNELRIEQSDLHQHRGLIPVDMLVIELVAAEIDDRHQRHLDEFARRLHPRQHPVDLAVMREAEEHFVDDPIGADGARDRDELVSAGLELTK